VTLVGSEGYVLACYRFAGVNSVRADMVAHPAEYPCSSYAYNALGEASDLVVGRKLYKTLGLSGSLRCEAYLALFGVVIPQKKRWVASAR